jgi:NAD(P) transhydrogenase
MAEATGRTGDHFDLVVIGSGPAGEKGATQAAYHGKRVAVVDRAPRPGGATVNNAGIPTKALRETALYVSGFRKKEVYGISLQLDARIAFERLRTRAGEVSTVMSDAVRHNLERHRIELVQGQARLAPGGEVRVASDGAPERRLRAEVVLIATGSRPLRPPNIPFDDPDVVDSEGILAFDQPFRSAVVVGGGPVGCEYASIFASLGIHVWLIDRAPRLLPFLDAEIAELLAQSFRETGIELLLGADLSLVGRDEEGLVVKVGDDLELRPDKLLFAAGRVGNTDGLGLEEVGVRLDERGRIIVDDHYRTSAENIFAAGDVIGPPALASVSTEQARVAMCHAFGIRFKEKVDPLSPAGIYSIPEVASVGLTEEAAAASGVDFEVGRGWFEKNPRAVVAGDTEGLVKLVFDRASHRLLGVHILGDDAGELVHVGQAVIHADGHVEDFIHTTFNLPTRTEMYKYAAYDGLTRAEARDTVPAGQGLRAPGP